MKSVYLLVAGALVLGTGIGFIGAHARHISASVSASHYRTPNYFSMITPVAVLSGWHYVKGGGLMLTYQDWGNENGGTTSEPSYGKITYSMVNVDRTAHSVFQLPRSWEMPALGLAPVSVQPLNLVSYQQPPAVPGEIGWTEPIASLIARHHAEVLPSSVRRRLDKWLGHHRKLDKVFWPNPGGMGL